MQSYFDQVDSLVEYLEANLPNMYSSIEQIETSEIVDIAESPSDVFARDLIENLEDIGYIEVGSRGHFFGGSAVYFDIRWGCNKADAPLKNYSVPVSLNTPELRCAVVLIGDRILEGNGNRVHSVYPSDISSSFSNNEFHNLFEGLMDRGLLKFEWILDENPQPADQVFLGHRGWLVYRELKSC